MRIAIFTDTFFPMINGVSTTVFNQANELVKRGHEVVVICPKSSGRSQIKDTRFSVVRLPLSLKLPAYDNFDIAVPTTVRSIRILRDFRPDVIHAMTEFGVGWEGRICSRIFRRPLVGTFHTYFAHPEYLKLVKLEKYEVVQKIVWAWSSSFFNKCDAILCPSKVTMREMKKHGFKRRVTYVSNGINLDDFDSVPDMQRLRKRYKLGKRNLIYVGRISVEKSLDILLKAFELAYKSLPSGTMLVIVGDGPYLDQIRQTASSMGMSGKVVFTGKIPHDRLLREGILKASDVFVTASKTENQPVSIMEAMASSLPIIGADALGIPDLVKHEKNGFLFRPDDVDGLAAMLTKIMSDEPLRKRLSRQSRKMIEEHSIQKVAEKLESIYEKTIVQHERRSKLYRLKKQYMHLKKEVESGFTDLEKEYRKKARKYKELLISRIRNRSLLKQRSRSLGFGFRRKGL